MGRSRIIRSIVRRSYAQLLLVAMVLAVIPWALRPATADTAASPLKTATPNQQPSPGSRPSTNLANTPNTSLTLPVLPNPQSGGRFSILTPSTPPPALLGAPPKVQASWVLTDHLTPLLAASG